MGDETRVQIRSDADIVTARREGRDLASLLGFRDSDLTLIATAISEVARNVVDYAGGGEIIFRATADGARRGIEIVSHDRGPGIQDVERAMQDGYSTGAGLGLGLPGARRLMDEFHIESKVGEGTTVTMKKWAS